MKYSLKKSFLIKESKEERVELNGTELTVYHLTQKSKLNKALLPREDANYEMPELTGDKAKDIISKAEYRKYPEMQEPSDSEIELKGISSILGDPFTQGTGFEPGTGDMYGPGLYTCFKFNPSIASTYGNVCLKFKFDISNCIICFEDLARQVHGDKWKVIDQVENILNKVNASQEINSNDTEVSDIVNDIKSFTGRKILHSGNIRGKSFLKENDFTSEIAYSISKLITKLGLSSFIDGLIFRGQHDGPVCVIYNPRRDAKLINIGRLKEEEVNWSNSISEFFGNNAYSNITFEDMNAISEENYTDEEIFDLKSIKEKIKIAKLVKDKNTPTEILTQIYRESSDNKIKIDIINHKNVDPELLYQIVNSLSYDDQNLVSTALNQRAFPAKTLVRKVLNTSDINSLSEDILIYVAGARKHHSKDLIDKLSDSTIQGVKMHCALSSKASVSTLLKLSKDEDPNVSSTAFSNNRLPFSYLENIEITDDLPLPTKGRIAKQTKDIIKLSILCKDENPYIRHSAISNRHITEELLEELMSDEDISVRSEVAIYTKDPIKLNILSQDPYIVVSDYAKKNKHYNPNIQIESLISRYINLILS